MLRRIKSLPGEPAAGIYEQPDRNSTVVLRMFPNQEVEVDDVEENGDWIRNVFPVGAPGTSGWIEKKYLDAIDGGLQPEPFSDGKMIQFVQECARHEYIAREATSIANHETEGAPKENYIIADYLIALAKLETNFDTVTTQLSGTDAIGPFQITTEEWDAFCNAPEGDGIAPSERAFVLSQIPAASFLTLKDWAEFDMLANGGGAFVPSFLDLFLARLIGAEAAMHVLTVSSDINTKSQDLLDTIKTKITDTAIFDALVERRAKWLKPSPGNASYSVSGFVDMASNKLAKALVSAFDLLQTHAKNYVALPVSAETPWLDKALEELPFWNGRKEDDPEGTKRIAEEYFPATDHPVVATAVAWCGAFAAWCMQESGNPVAAASIPRGSAKAANWMNWGTRTIRPGAIRRLNDDALRGSVVLFRSDGNTDDIGHVGFAVKRAPTSEKVDCVSGNDSDTARQRPYDISRIVAIRQLDIPAPAAPSGDITDKITAFVKDWESFKADAYLDEFAKIWTIGYGTTSRAGIGVEVRQGDVVTEPQAADYLNRTLSLFAQQIAAGFKDRQPNADQFGSMLSLAYNVGAGGFLESTVLRMFNEKNDAAAADAFKLWNKSSGAVVQGLVNRRAAERDWFLGNYTLRT